MACLQQRRQAATMPNTFWQVVQLEQEIVNDRWKIVEANEHNILNFAQTSVDTRAVDLFSPRRWRQRCAETEKRKIKITVGVGRKKESVVQIEMWWCCAVWSENVLKSSSHSLNLTANPKKFSRISSLRCITVSPSLHLFRNYIFSRFESLCGAPSLGKIFSFYDFRSFFLALFILFHFTCDLASANTEMRNYLWKVHTHSQWHRHTHTTTYTYQDQFRFMSVSETFSIAAKHTDTPRKTEQLHWTHVVLSHLSRMALVQRSDDFLYWRWQDRKMCLCVCVLHTLL